MSDRMKWEWKLGIAPGFKKGNKLYLKIKNRFRPKGEASPNWVGDDIGYTALHIWVRKQLGRPEKCTACEKIGEIVKMRWSIQYANISGEYKRDLTDWRPLCIPCHVAFDKKRKQSIDIR